MQTVIYIQSGLSVEGKIDTDNPLRLKTVTHSITPGFAMELHLETHNPLGGTTVDIVEDVDGNEKPSPVVIVLVRGGAADGQPLATLTFEPTELKDRMIYPVFDSEFCTLTPAEKLAWLTYAGLDTDDESIMDFAKDYGFTDDCSYEKALSMYFDSELAWDLTSGPVGGIYRAEHKRLVELWYIEQEVNAELANV